MTEYNTATPGGTPAPAPPPDGAQPQWAAQSQSGAQSAGLDPKVGGLLSYLLGWLGGLIMFFTQKDPEVRFHAAQSILLSIGFVAVYVALGIVSTILATGLGSFAAFGLFSLIYTLLGLAGLALWVFLCVKGYRLEHYKLPVIGDMAESWAAK